jgi:hypothetical protein
MVMRLQLLSVALTLIVFISGCKRLEKADLDGRYLADDDLATEELTLDTDGDYTQKVTLKSTHKTHLANGKWTFDRIRGCVYVTFDKNFIVVRNDFGKLRADYNQPRKGLVGMPADTICSGRVALGTAKSCIYMKVTEK